MQVRLDYTKAAPDAFKAVYALEQYVSRDSGLPARLLHLIKIRASHINGCAYCIDMHVKEARRSGLSEQWINLINVWRESPLFDEKERVLLEWTEAVTNISATSTPDSVYDPLKEYFSDEEITKLTVAISMINVWNRLSIGFRSLHPIDN
jgi:AhpD family alkylhydroperoxidase